MLTCVGESTASIHLLGTETSEPVSCVPYGLLLFLILIGISEHVSIAFALTLLPSSAPLSTSPLYVSNIIVQFVLLLAMFVKPILLSHGKTQSGGAVYRRVVRRNVACTICIVFSYIIATLVVIFAVLNGSHEVRFMLQTIPRVATRLTLGHHRRISAVIVET